MSVLLEVKERAVRPRFLRNQLRHSGHIPAVVYGYNIESTPIAVEEKELVKILRSNGANTVITLTIGSKKINTLIHKTQLDTFTHQIIHVEFLAVNMNETTEVEAEIILVGEAQGVKSGGVLAQNLYHVTVSATPNNLPEYIELDITNLSIGDALTVGELSATKEYTILTDTEEQIVSITAKTTESEEIQEAAEPEVIGEENE